MHCEQESLDDLLQWRELLYSVKTLREYNTDIEVKVYVSPPERVATITKFPDMRNLEIIGFELPENPDPFPNPVVAKWIDMKYNAAFTVLKQGYDSVLMIDADTIYQYDVNEILEKYNKRRFYACPDPYGEFYANVGMKYPGMNDGVVLIPKWALDYEEVLMAERHNFTKNLAEEHQGMDKTSEIWIRGICWASFQYGISEYLRKKGKAVDWFDKHDVCTLYDWTKFMPAEQSIVTILHYWHVGYETILPKEYWEDLTETPMKELNDMELG
jgi:hypothetical protein